jgi:hypothetical protein
MRPAGRSARRAMSHTGGHMLRVPLMTGAAVLAAAFLVAACGPARPDAAGGSARPATSAPAASAPAPAAPAAPTQPTAAATPATSAPAASAAPAPASPAPGSSAPAAVAGSMVGPANCAAMAARTFVHITAVRAGAAGVLTVTGHPVRLACGGVDDLSYDERPGVTVTGQVTAGASVVTFPLTAMAATPIAPARLAAYLARHQGLGIFLVTGPLGRITGLQEEYHP